MKTAMIIGIFYESDLWMEKAKDLGYNIIATHPIDLSDKTYYDSVLPFIDEFYIVSYANFDELVSIAKKHNVEMLITHPCSNDALVATGYVNTALNLKGVPYNAALNAGSKYDFHKLLEENNLPRASYTTKCIDSPEIEFPCIVKPNFGAGSIGVKKIHSEEELDLFFKTKDCNNGYKLTKPKYDYYLIQEFMEGDRILGCNAVVNNGKVEIFGKTYRDLVKERDHEPYFYGQEFITTHDELTDETLYALEELISVLELDFCPFKVEILLDSTNNIKAFIEINLRPAAMNTALAFDHIYGFDNAGEQVKLATSAQSNFTRKYETDMKYMMVKNLVFSTGKIKNITWPSIHKNIISFDTELKPGTVIKPFMDVNSSSINGYILIIGKDEDEIYEIADGFTKNIQIEYE